MTNVALESLIGIAPDAEELSEAGTTYILLPKLKVATGDIVKVLDALLCPMQHNGYSTRLFLSEPITNRGANWTQWQIFGRTWHTWSWNNVPANISLPQMVLEHLQALR
jgi:hypothetical protein